MDKDKQDLQAVEEEEDNFEELLNQSEVRAVTFQPGEKVEAVVIEVSRDWIFIDVGGKSEGIIAADEFNGGEGEPSIKEGSEVEAYFLSF